MFEKRPFLPHLHIEYDEAVELETITNDEVEEEPPFRVLIHNDDVTPMDFVVGILLKIFKVMLPEAEQIMLTAHFQNIAYVQTLPKSEAQARVGKAHFAANLEGYPLKFSIEPE